MICGCKNAIRLLLILGIVCGVCLFLVGAIRENIAFFKTPSELIISSSCAEKIRLGGIVVEGSVKTADVVHTFQITDNIHTINVLFKGHLLPDLFREGHGVIAIGFYDEKNKIFEAKQLLSKHDQYYKPPQKKK